MNGVISTQNSKIPRFVQTSGTESVGRTSVALVSTLVSDPMSYERVLPA